MTPNPDPAVRLIVTDMDGTLLDGESRLDPRFYPMLDELLRRGIRFAVASGRQYYTLLDQFADYAGRIDFIAENGTYVVLASEGTCESLSTNALITGISREDAHHAIRLVRTLPGARTVLCGAESAYIEDRDPYFVSEVSRFYRRMRQVEDLTADLGDRFLKIAVFAAKASVPMRERLAVLEDRFKVVISGDNWVDLGNPVADKGAGLRRVLEYRGIDPAEVLAFGDQMNDREMLELAGYSYAMANGAPDLKPFARFIAPANTEAGVLRVISNLIFNLRTDNR